MVDDPLSIYGNPLWLLIREKAMLAFILALIYGTDIKPW